MRSKPAPDVCQSVGIGVIERKCTIAHILKCTHVHAVLRPASCTAAAARAGPGDPDVSLVAASCAASPPPTSARASASVSLKGNAPCCTSCDAPMCTPSCGALRTAAAARAGAGEPRGYLAVASCASSRAATPSTCLASVPLKGNALVHAFLRRVVHRCSGASRSRSPWCGPGGRLLLRKPRVEHSHVLEHGLHVRAQSTHLLCKLDKDSTSCSPIARPFGGSVLLRGGSAVPPYRADGHSPGLPRPAWLDLHVEIYPWGEEWRLMSGFRPQN